jgi:hypothetical protein
MGVLNMFRSVHGFLKAGNYPSAIREHIKITIGANTWTEFTEYEKSRIINNAQMYCDNYLLTLFTARKAMEIEFN